MKYRLIDYSELYYGAPMPSKRKVKFVQIRYGNIEFMVMSPDEHSAYHATIVEQFCQEKLIQGVYSTAKMDDFRVRDEKWKVVGGGYWEIDDDEKRLSLSGSSQVYGRFDPAELKEKIHSRDEMSGYDVSIQ